MPPPEPTTLSAPADGVWVLRLFVTGMTPRSLGAIRRIKALCEELLAGHYDLEVVDIYQRPELATREQIIATPTLLRKSPLPLRRLVGDLSDRERVLAGLDLHELTEEPR